MQTAKYFDPDEYDIKHIRFLNEINAAVSCRWWDKGNVAGQQLTRSCRDAREWPIRKLKASFPKNMQLDKQTNFTIDIQALAASHISASYQKRIPIVKSSSH